MKITLAIFMTLISLQLFAAPIRGLGDLPQRWAGSFGDLMGRTDSTFVIRTYMQVNTSNRPLTVDKYVTDATLTVGTRSYSVVGVTVITSGASESADIILALNDELQPFLSATVTYDANLKQWKMKAFATNGAHLFVFHDVP